MNFRAEIPVIYYHSAGIPDLLWPRNYHTMDLPFFERQMQYFARNFKVITLQEYWNIRNGISRPVKNALVITFDDGYLDNWVFVFPLLKKYDLPVTIFVSPALIEQGLIVRQRYDEYGTAEEFMKEPFRQGYLSWEEMRLMERSGLVSIESHTLTHTKYFVSDKLSDFHHPGRDSLYIIGNLYPHLRSRYFSDSGFSNCIPDGYPVFEEASSVIARRIFINSEFIREVTERLSSYNFSAYTFDRAFLNIKEIYDSYREKGLIISGVEEESERLERLYNEIAGSKGIIEKELGKKVKFLCWPHGDSSPEAHRIALESGYLLTTAGNSAVKDTSSSRIPGRTGMSTIAGSPWLSAIRAGFRIRRDAGAPGPYKIINKLYQNWFKPFGS